MFHLLIVAKLIRQYIICSRVVIILLQCLSVLVARTYSSSEWPTNHAVCVCHIQKAADDVSNSICFIIFEQVIFVSFHTLWLQLFDHCTSCISLLLFWLLAASYLDVNFRNYAVASVLAVFKRNGNKTY